MKKEYVYVLKLVNDKYYIGHTTRLNGERLLEHMKGAGAKWTKIYKPIGIISIQYGSREDEKQLTLQYMLTFGWQNVRGGPWTKIDLENPPEQLLDMQMESAVDYLEESTYNNLINYCIDNDLPLHTDRNKLMDVVFNDIFFPDISD
jgi:hypothetical protein